MVVFVRAKRATCPLDDMAKARLCTSNTSAHCYADHEASCLSGLVHDFLDPAAAPDDGFATDDDQDAGDRSSGAATADALRRLLCPPAKDDVFRARLLVNVSDAAESLSLLRSTGLSAYRRAVMARLRSVGYDAGVCTSKWEASTGSALMAGCYEYIDVVHAAAGGGGQTVRYVADVDFAAEFEIARPTPAYGQVLSTLPRVVVVTAEELRLSVKVVAEAVGRSFRSQGMSVPLWRKSRCMFAKWLGPYRRTVSVC